MKVKIKKVQIATSSKTNKDFLVCHGIDDVDGLPVKFFAGVNDYKVGDTAELYVDTDFNYMARVSHKKI